jgi:TatA/E family protein of Tat protein translocase
VFNVGVPEMMVILLVALLVFGPNRLPEIARNMGKFIRNFQQETNRALSDLKEGMGPGITAGIFDVPDAGTPADEIVAAKEVPAAAFGATTGTRRKTSTRAPTARRKPSPAAKKKTAPVSVKKKAAPAAKKKLGAKKTTKR